MKRTTTMSPRRIFFPSLIALNPGTEQLSALSVERVSRDGLPVPT